VGVGRGALAIIADALDRAVALLLGAVTVDGCKPSDLIGGRWLDDRSARAPESLGCQRRILERAFRADRVSRALQRANEVRSARAKLKKELAAGTVELAQIPADPPACVRTARVPASGARQLAPPREPAPVSHRACTPVEKLWKAAREISRAWIHQLGSRAAYRTRVTPAHRHSPDANRVLTPHKGFASSASTCACSSRANRTASTHRESHQEDFLVLAGECTLLVEDQERQLQAWDFVHCPPDTEHIFIGAGT
jgi:mannose-6-phosphate isomerase-like protein (cupin superfamily)